MNEKNIVDLYVNEKQSCQSIGKKYNISKETIRHILKRNGVNFRRGAVGCIPWNKGNNFKKEQLDKTIELVKLNALHGRCAVNVRNHMKRYLIHTNGNKCCICGLTEWRGQPIPLVCDHINGDTTDSNVSNFRIVCCNCDAQLPTYKSKNKKIGNKYNREYYQKKKNG